MNKSLTVYNVFRSWKLWKLMRIRFIHIFFPLLTIFFISPGFAANQVINLDVAYKTVYFANKARKAIAVNNQIPAPTLHFKEGDHVTINVSNHLDKGTAIHWHGLLVPWQMDGVEGVSQTEIPPGAVLHPIVPILSA
jgi:hypothetical protein